MTSTPLKISDISIIIPTLNEESEVDHWGEFNSHSGEDGACEVIIVDGGSTDQTVARAQSRGFRVETCPPGRGAQLNYGARLAQGKVLLFLHADTRMPPGFAGLILQCLNETATLAGAFSLVIDQSTFSLRFVAWCANLRSRLFQLPYGDQALFIRRDDFWRMGGFPEIPIMEDFIFVRKAGKQGRVTTLAQAVTTSARRWRRLGVMRATIINQLVILGFYAGVPLAKLASLYRR
jgi:rSAM/selenodomain-associated transferase 2